MSDHEEPEDIILHVKTRWDEQSSDSDDDSDKASSNIKKTSALTELDMLLSSVSGNPSYAKPSNTPQFVAPVIEKSKPPLNEVPCQIMPSNDSDVLHNFSANNKLSAPEKINKLKEKVPLKAAAVGKGFEKETAKDRVKRQRIAGQSGIGSEFREWRSDEEMRLRQHFD